MAQWIRHQTSDLGIAGSSPATVVTLFQGSRITVVHSGAVALGNNKSTTVMLVLWNPPLSCNRMIRIATLLLPDYLTLSNSMVPLGGEFAETCHCYWAL